uniref:Uncharacterized protein n=1 Tax=Anopheles merus TaxID=30066 RepID=A0A182UVB9_ANOME
MIKVHLTSTVPVVLGPVPFNRGSNRSDSTGSERPLQRCRSFPSEGRYWRSRSNASFRFCIRFRSRAFAASRRFFLIWGGTCLRFRLPITPTAPPVVPSECTLFGSAALGNRLLGKVRQDRSAREVASVSAPLGGSGFAFGFRLYWRFFTGRLGVGGDVLQPLLAGWIWLCAVASGGGGGGGESGSVAEGSSDGSWEGFCCCMAIRFSLYSSTSTKLRWGELASE